MPPDVTPVTAAFASLHFRDPNDFAAGGEIVLRGSDSTIQLLPSPPLRRELDGIVDRVDAAGLKWGTSLIVGLAAIGTALFLRNRRGAAFAVLSASGLAGAGAFGARRYASTMAAWLLSPISVTSIDIRRLDDGGLRIVMNGGGLRRLVAVLKPEEINLAEADAFMKAFIAVSSPR